MDHSPISSKELSEWKKEAADDEYAFIASKILQSCGTLSRQDYLETCLLMEDLFPGRGWKETADQLHRFYYLSGLPLKEKPLKVVFQ